MCLLPLNAFRIIVKPVYDIILKKVANVREISVLKIDMTDQ